MISDNQTTPALQAICPAWYRPPVHYVTGGLFMDRASRILGVSVAEIRIQKRSFEYTRRRFAIAHVMRDCLNFSYPRIAKALGHKDHATVISGIRRSKELVEICPDHAALVDALEMVA